jgi:hypothetical protein
VLVADAGCVYTDEELSHFKGNQDWHLHRDYNRSMTPIIYISRGLISDKPVNHPVEGTSTPLKATGEKRGSEEESREEPRVIQDNHSTIATRAY